MHLGILDAEGTNITVAVPPDWLAGIQELFVNVTDSTGNRTTLALNITVTQYHKFSLDIPDKRLSCLNGRPVGGTLILRNDGNGKERFTLSIEGKESGWVSLPDMAPRMEPKSERTLKFDVNVPPAAAPGKYQFTVVARGEGNLTRTASFSVTVKERVRTDTVPWFVLGLVLAMVLAVSMILYLVYRQKRRDGMAGE
jgi:uncharacterized membrane protein